MRFTSPTLLSVFFITFVSAIPAPDKYQHRYEPDCPVLRSTACLLVDWCQHHRDRGDLFTTPNNELKSRDVPETQYSDLNLTDALSPLSFATRELDVNLKRANLAKSVQCGTLSCVANREVSEMFATLIPGQIYDVIIDYPYNGATGGKPWLLFFLPISPSTFEILSRSINLPLTKVPFYS